jgi:hypothetical protein
MKILFGFYPDVFVFIPTILVGRFETNTFCIIFEFLNFYVEIQISKEAEK